MQSYYLLAKNSVEGKKEERINATITSYEEFIDEFPKSEDLKGAENIYKKAVQERDLINSNKKQGS